MGRCATRQGLDDVLKESGCIAKERATILELLNARRLLDVAQKMLVAYAQHHENFVETVSEYRKMRSDKKVTKQCKNHEAHQNGMEEKLYLVREALQQSCVSLDHVNHSFHVVVRERKELMDVRKKGQVNAATQTASDAFEVSSQEKTVQLIL